MRHTRAAIDLNSLVPEASNQPYDIRDVIHAVVDERYFFEVHQHYAQNIVVHEMKRRRDV